MSVSSVSSWAMDTDATTSPVARVDQTAVFGSPRVWIPLVGILVLIGGFITWGLLARAPLTVATNGVITTSGGSNPVHHRWATRNLEHGCRRSGTSGCNFGPR